MVDLCLWHPSLRLHALASELSLGGSLGADAECGLYRELHLEDGSYVGFMVDASWV